MRIPIYTNSRPSLDGPARPPVLARLGEDGELVLVELQGSLEMDGCDPRGGETIGILQFPPGRENHPVLQISHHRLEGTIVSLRRPWAILEKKAVPVPPASPLSDAETDLSSSPPRATFSPPASPTMARKRARFSEKENYSAEHDTLKTPARSSKAPTMLSSSPMPERSLRYSDGHFDFSSPNAKAPEAKRLPTSTSYSVVTIIRKKILFSKRPEPIVKLDA